MPLQLQSVPEEQPNQQQSAGVSPPQSNGQPAGQPQVHFDRSEEPGGSQTSAGVALMPQVPVPALPPEAEAPPAEAAIHSRPLPAGQQGNLRIPLGWLDTPSMHQPWGCFVPIKARPRAGRTPHTAALLLLPLWLRPSSPPPLPLSAL